MSVFERLVSAREDVIFDSENLGISAIVDNAPVLANQVVVFPRTAGPRHMHELDLKTLSRMWAVAADIGARMMTRITPPPELVIYHVEGRKITDHVHVVVAPSLERHDFGPSYDPDHELVVRKEGYITGVQELLGYSPEDVAAFENKLTDAGL